jgi:hypothetical protein
MVSLVSTALIAAPATAHATAGSAPTDAPSMTATGAELARASLDGDSAVATTEAMSVTMPLDSGEALQITAAGTRQQPVTFTLPAELDLRRGAVSPNGAVAYASAGEDASAVVMVTEDGATQVQTVIPSTDATHNFTYAFAEATTLALREDGGVDVLLVDDEGAATVTAQVAAPWAVDAKGETVTTRYAVDGNELTQFVDTDPDATYPIVADPRVTVGNGVYFYLQRHEIVAFASAAQAALAGGAGVACAVYGKRVAAIPGAKTIVDFMCKYVSPGALVKLFQSIPSHTASYYTGSCYELRWYPPNQSWVKSVSSSLC